jgi:hypothetical protein
MNQLFLHQQIIELGSSSFANDVFMTVVGLQGWECARWFSLPVEPEERRRYYGSATKWIIIQILPPPKTGQEL